MKKNLEENTNLPGDVCGRGNVPELFFFPKSNHSHAVLKELSHGIIWKHSFLGGGVEVGLMRCLALTARLISPG